MVAGLINKVFIIGLLQETWKKEIGQASLMVPSKLHNSLLLKGSALFDSVWHRQTYSFKLNKDSQ